MKIMTGTVLFTLLMMPVAVIADVTHKVSGNVTITKYQENDEFYVWWQTVSKNSNLPGSNMTRLVAVKLLDVQGNGTVPFEMTCDPNDNDSPKSPTPCEGDVETRIAVGRTGHDSYDNPASTVIGDF